MVDTVAAANKPLALLVLGILLNLSRTAAKLPDVIALLVGPKAFS